VTRSFTTVPRAALAAAAALAAPPEPPLATTGTANINALAPTAPIAIRPWALKAFMWSLSSEW
jgi:hypothetical protein